MALLEVKGLSVRYEPKYSADLTAVDDVSFTLDEGEFVGLIGESGSGKSTLATAILQLLQKPGRISEGKILFDGVDLTTLDPEKLRAMRWNDIATVFQASMNALNPVIRVEAQFRDVIELHTSLRGEAVTERIRELFDMVMIDHRFITAYPHELSGGMKQRVNLALCLANRPRFVLLDEPTTGLDVVVQASILANIRELQRTQGFAVLFISHDIGTVLDICDRIMVMYAGRIVENQPAGALLEHALHPYSKGLLGSYGDPRADTVRITYVPGRPPDLARRPSGCAFAARCPEAIERCRTDDPWLVELAPRREVACHVAIAQEKGLDGVGERVDRFAGPEFVKTAEQSERANEATPILEVAGVSKVYRRRKGLRTLRTDAVIDASFTLRRGQVTALVGQSGSGKSTLARMVTGVEKPTAGSIVFHRAEGAGEVPVHELRPRQLRDYRADVQMVFQDPYSALNPAKTLRQSLARPLVNYRGLRGQALEDRIDELLETVALTPTARYRDRYAYELSGGQRQRVVIARALAAEPELIIADEPISSLDVSIRAEILELLNSLVQTTGVSILYITHDLLSARMLADEVIVLNGGRVVEQGPALSVIREPADDYTRLLLDAVPNPFDRPAA